MHFVGLALRPAKKTADAVPAIVFVIIVRAVAALLAVDDEFLIGLRQFLERDVDVDLFPRAGAQQILLRLAELLAAKNTDGSLLDAETAIGDRLVQINRDGATESATFRARAERIVETKKTHARRTNIDIAVRTMPAGGKRMRDGPSRTGI